jgi:hypothetical protein
MYIQYTELGFRNCLMQFPLLAVFKAFTVDMKTFVK